MRTTLNIEDEALVAARQLAKAHSLPLGQAASLLIQRGLRYGPPIVNRNGFPVMQVDGPAIRGEEVKRADEAAW